MPEPNNHLCNRASLIYLLLNTLCPNYTVMVGSSTLPKLPGKTEILRNQLAIFDDIARQDREAVGTKILIASHSEDQSELFNRAEQAYQQSHLAEAARYLQQILSKNYDNAKA